MINPTTGGGFASSAFLDSSGNPMTVNGAPVAGMLTNGTGSVTNITSGSPNPNPPNPNNNTSTCGSAFSSSVTLSAQGFWVSDTSNGQAVGGATQSHSSMCGHRVTWTELR